MDLKGPVRPHQQDLFIDRPNPSVTSGKGGAKRHLIGVRRENQRKVKSLEIFAGAGGLGLGSARAGFEHVAVLDWDKAACETLRRNRDQGVDHIKNWKIIEGDLRSNNFEHYRGRVDVVFGGPPCQPFSIGGKHLGHEDDRNMFPEAIRVIRDVRPDAFMFENVRGLLRPTFATYYSYIIHQLSFPDILRRNGEPWQKHLSRLERVRRTEKHTDRCYDVVFACHNAVNFGVPQRRERVFVVGIRTDLGRQFTFPAGTYTQEALLHDQWVTGVYWERHRIARRQRPALPTKFKKRVDRLLVNGTRGKPWRTVRDAIGDLPTITADRPTSKIQNHVAIPGARSYPGHDGSNWDEPAKTLKAGNHGVPGGENTIRDNAGSVRYFTVRECARLQTFPDDWVFKGSWGESMRQLGNAVPVELATSIASQLMQTLSSDK